ncbi:MAG: alpha/beta fold hydrolase [Acidimicrobiales bacterium]
MTTTFPAATVIDLSGTHAPDDSQGPIHLSVHDTGGGEDRPPVVFVHGFPELGYSWRHQLPEVAGAGFRAIAPDMRGYGGSSRPDDISAYGLGNLCGDLADLLDALEIDRAIFVGHDWGGFVAWGMPVLFPDRCAGVAGVCTPYTPFPGTDVLRMLAGGDDDALYMLWFQEPGVAEAVIDRTPRLLFEKLMRSGVDPSELLARQAADGGTMDMNPFRRLPELDSFGELIATEDVVEHYGTVFAETGFRGGINWYRNIDANAAAHPEIGSKVLDLPTLMLCAEWDPALSPALAANMPNVCTDLEMHTIERAGHWVQQECPDQLNALLVDWLVRRFGS